MNEKKQENNNLKNKFPIIIFLIVLVLISIAPYIITRDFTKYGFVSFKDSGQIGDTIGGITAPLVGLISAYLVYRALKAQIDANNVLSSQFSKQQIDTMKALQLQSDANSLLREQLVQQQTATNKQIKDADIQHKMLVRQNFEHSFFQMLSIHHEIVNKAYLEMTPATVSFNQYLVPKMQEKLREKYIIGKELDNELKGKNFFKVTSELLLDLIQIKPEDIIPEHSQIIKYASIQYKNKQLNLNYESIYMLLYKQLDTNLGHYFRNLYRIIKMIDDQYFHDRHENSKNFEERYYFASIVRAQLSDYEVKWLFFNGLNEHGKIKFKPLIEKYALLKILDNSNDSIIQVLKPLYKESAFKKHNRFVKSS